MMEQEKHGTFQEFVGRIEVLLHKKECFLIDSHYPHNTKRHIPQRVVSDTTHKTCINYIEACTIFLLFDAKIVNWNLSLNGNEE